MKFQWSIIQHELSSIDHQISSINHQVSSIKQKYRQSSIDYQLWNFKYRLSSLVILFNYYIWIIKFQVCIKYQLSSVNDPVQTESMVNNQISIMKMMKYEVYTGCLKKWGFCICLISWEPGNRFLNCFFFWKLRSMIWTIYVNSKYRTNFVLFQGAKIFT